MRLVVTRAAAMYKPHFDASAGKRGFVCAQVNPSRAGEREPMMAMARRIHAWAPNIAVKLPAVAAGLDVLEDCVAEGISDGRHGQLHRSAGRRHRGTVPGRAGSGRCRTA